MYSRDNSRAKAVVESGIRRFAFGYCGAAVLVASVIVLLSGCAKAGEIGQTREGSVAIPECVVWGVAALADDRRVAVNCGAPAQSIVIVDVQTQNVVATIPTAASVPDAARGFVAMEDGSLVWFGLPRGSPPHELGLQRSVFPDDEVVTTMLAADTGPEVASGRVPTIPGPSQISISSRFNCAVWEDSWSIHQFDLESNENIEVLLTDLPGRDVFRVSDASCARNDEGQVVTLLGGRVGPPPGDQIPRFNRGFVVGRLDQIRTDAPFLIRQPVGSGHYESFAFSAHEALVFMDYRATATPFFSSLPGFDFDAQTCGFSSLVYVNLQERSARCVARFASRNRPVGFAPDFRFWADGCIYAVSADADSISCIQRVVSGLHSISPRTGRLFAWVKERGRLYFRIM